MTSEALWAAISHPKRREILDVLVDAGALGVGELAARAALTYPATSQHLAVLARAHLVAVTPIGRARHYRAELEPLVQILDWLTRAASRWRDQPRQLAAYLNSSDSQKEQP